MSGRSQRMHILRCEPNLAHVEILIINVFDECRLLSLKNMTTSSNGNISALLALCAGNSPVTTNVRLILEVWRKISDYFVVVFLMYLRTEEKLFVVTKLQNASTVPSFTNTV